MALVRYLRAGALICTVTVASLVATTTHAMATTVQVSPVLVDASGGSSAEKVTLSNLGDAQLNAQVRVFKWVQRDGNDVLEPTREVIASPPAVQMAPGAAQVIRVVRVDKAPLAGEASYRLVVDQLPKPGQPTRSAVNFVMRYSVPVFFSPTINKSSPLAWTAEAKGGSVVLTARNVGPRRVRIAELSLQSQSGTPLASRKGLVGYVLAGSTASWTIPASGLTRGAAVSIVAQGDEGPIRGQAVAQ